MFRAFTLAEKKKRLIIRLNKFRQLDITVSYSSEKNEKFGQSSGSYLDFQSMIRISENLLL